MSQILSIKSNKPVSTVILTDGAISKVGELIAAEGEQGLRCGWPFVLEAVRASPTRCSSTQNSNQTTSSRALAT